LTHQILNRVVMLCLTAVLLTALVPASLQAQDELLITIGTTDFPASIDPASAVDLPSWELLNHLYTGLTRQIPGTLDYELALAADHTISEDGLTHTYTLRADAAFADGTPITAAVVADSINRVVDLGRDGADFVNRYITGISTGDDNSVVFTLLSPLPDFDALVGLPPFFPVHPAVYPLDDLVRQEDATTIISSGPYQIAVVDPEEQIDLVPNPTYDGDAPANDRIVLRHYDLPIDLRRALETGDVDVAWRALALPDLDVISRNANLVINEQSNLQTYYMLLNHNPIGQANRDSFDDPAVREAFALLIKREESATLGYDETVTPLYTILPPEFGDWTTSAFPAYDYELADAVLEEAGYRPRRRTVNVPVYISTDTYGDLTGDAASELRRFITESEILGLSGITDSQTTTFISAVSRGEYTSAIIGWRPHYASPGGYLVPLVQSDRPIPANANYGSDAIDQRIIDAALSTNADTQAALYLDIQAELLAGYNLIPLWQGKDVIVTHSDITGVVVEHNSWLRFDSLTR
jgi:peptide/nickel transport system substrate-binding protein